ncbi:MAG: hypothetical protein QFB86_00915 [Patescibacteria group bacterium]|nr:hypothetical protein [Patescibacteria group bacterium]
MEEWFAQMEVTSKSWLNSIAENDCDESTCASLRVASTNALINEVNTHLIIEKLITNGEEE